jgi:hypothetical protein
MARQAIMNVALNGLANTRVIPAMASDASGASVANPAGPPAQVPAITIDEACPGPIALMKINAGGREAAVLAGSAATIERDRPAVVFEYAAGSPPGGAQCPFGRLANAGYLLYRLSSRRHRLTGRYSLRLDPQYSQPETSGRLLAVSEGDAHRIIVLVAYRDGRT